MGSISIQQVRAEIEAVLKTLPSSVDLKAEQFSTLSEKVSKLLRRIGAKRVRRSGANFTLELYHSFQTNVSGVTLNADDHVTCCAFLSGNSLELCSITGIKVCKGNLPWVYVDNVLIMHSPSGVVTIDARVKRFGLTYEHRIVIGPDGKIIKES